MEGRAIDNMRTSRHQSVMRFTLLFLAVCLASAAHADPRAPQCSSGKWGHAHCIRQAHFVHDTCSAIEVFADRHDLDVGFFARLIWQESRFDPNALSPANARGIAQFIPSTARLRGLKDPYNAADALEHSAHYLAEMVMRYGNEGLAAVGYNGGEGRAAGFLVGKGLAQETVNYVPIITGLSAQAWRDTPPAAHDFSLSPDEPFYPACTAMARNRALTPVKRPVLPEPAIKRWGVQLGFGTTKEAARTKIRSQTASCRAQVTREKLDLIFVKNRVSGRTGFYFARIGREERRDAQNLCTSLRQQQCTCLVVENK